ncbi:MAG: hypothetical protein VX498_12970 [Myxococcota bacterium]|nr:hypothetical protein [Myxococcota bacterium]
MSLAHEDLEDPRSGGEAPSPWWRLGRKHRVIAGALGVSIALPVAVTLDPYGIYAPEKHLGSLAIGALIGAVVGASAAPLLRLPGRLGAVVAGLIVLAVLAVTHVAGLALMFSLAADRRVLFCALIASGLLAAVARIRGLRISEVALLMLAPPLVACTIQYANFVRGPEIDCKTVAEHPGVKAVALWPSLGAAEINSSLPYDVLADEGEDIVFASFVDQVALPGCGAIAAWGPARGRPTVVTEGLREAGATGAQDCRVTMRMRIDPDRNLLFVPAASYEGLLPPQLFVYHYAVTEPGGVELEQLHTGPLPIEPSDMVLTEGSLVLLGYPRRFAEDPSSKLARMDLSKPTAPVVTSVVPFEPEGWMTEYAAPAADDGLLYVTDVFGHLFEVGLDDFAVLRKVRPGAATLEAAVWGGVLFAAAPYRRSVLVIDRSTLTIRETLPAGNAMRELVVDQRKGRLFSTSYGDGTLHAWQLGDGGRQATEADSLRLGRPMRGLDLLSESGHLLVGGGCGVFEVDPAEALGL